MKHVKLFEQFVNESVNRIAKFNMQSEYGKTITDFLDTYFYSRSANKDIEAVKDLIYDSLKREIDAEINNANMDDWSSDDLENFLIRLINTLEDGESYIAYHSEESTEDEDLENEIRDLERDLEDMHASRAEMDIDMDIEAGQVIAQGKEWTDADGNRWGSAMNKADRGIEKAERELSKLKDPKANASRLKMFKKLAKSEVDKAIKLINKI